MTKARGYREVVKFLRSQGWVLLRQGKGSHEIWGNPDDPRMTMSIPHHEVSAGIVRQIIAAFPDAPRNWR